MDKMLTDESDLCEKFIDSGQALNSELNNPVQAAPSASTSQQLYKHGKLNQF
jgi:hypothetical protein